VVCSLSNQPTCQPATSSKDACTSAMLVSCLKPCHCCGHVTLKEIQTNNTQQGHVHFSNTCFLSKTPLLLGTCRPKRDPAQIEEPVIDVGSALPNSHLSFQHPLPPATSLFVTLSYFRIFSFMLVKENSKNHLPTRHLWHLTANSILDSLLIFCLMIETIFSENV